MKVSVLLEISLTKSIQIMSQIDHFDLRSFDLNLLIAFDALMRERSVTRAADLLKIRQPAMSHSLSLLRTLFQDELFVRVGTVMQPTARALALAEPVEQALSMMQTVIHARSEFDPRLTSVSFAWDSPARWSYC